MFFLLGELGWGRTLVNRRKKEKSGRTLYARAPFAIVAFPTLSLSPSYHSPPPCCPSHPLVVSEHVEDELGGVEPTPVASKHIENGSKTKGEGSTPPLSKRKGLRRVGRGCTLAVCVESH